MYGHIVPPAEVAEDRVLNVRRQLAKGEYDVKGRLGAAFDKLVEELVAESEPGNMASNANGGSNANRTRILIVDDHAIVRQGLTRLVEVECDLMVCAEAENAAQAMEAMDLQEFDLAIVDISLEDGNGLELTAKMKSRRPGMTILVLSMYDGLPYAQRALQAGAAGYVAKYEAPEKIITAIHQVLGGKVYVSNSKVTRAMCGAASAAGGDPNNSRINEIHSAETSRHGVPNHVPS